MPKEHARYHAVEYYSRFSMSALKDARKRPDWCSATRWRMELARRRQVLAAQGGKSNRNRNGGEEILVTTTRR